MFQTTNQFLIETTMVTGIRHDSRSHGISSRGISTADPLFLGCQYSDRRLQ